VGLLIFLVGERLVKGKESLLAQNRVWLLTGMARRFWYLSWAFPYGTNPSTAFSFLQFKPAGSGVRIQAFVRSNKLPAASVGCALGSVFIYQVLLPLPEGWFRFNWRGNWFLWGGWLLRGAAPSSCGVAD